MWTVIALFVMFFLPLLFLWVPVPGLVGFISGLIGGYLIGQPGRAFLVALIPFGIMAALITLGVLFAAVVDPWLSLFGGVAGGFLLIWLFLHKIAMVLGAFVGGFLYEYRRRRRLPSGRAEIYRTGPHDDADPY